MMMPFCFSFVLGFFLLLLLGNPVVDNMCGIFLFFGLFFAFPLSFLGGEGCSRTTAIYGGGMALFFR